MKVIQRVLTWLIVIAVLVCLVLLFSGQLPKVLGWLVTLAVGLLGITAKATVGTAGAVVNEVAKGAGAKPIPKNNQNKPRRPGPSAVSPTPAEGERRARSRRNRRNYR